MPRVRSQTAQGTRVRLTRAEEQEAWIRGEQVDEERRREREARKAAKPPGLTGTENRAKFRVSPPPKESPSEGQA